MYTLINGRYISEDLSSNALISKDNLTSPSFLRIVKKIVIPKIRNFPQMSEYIYALLNASFTLEPRSDLSLKIPSGREAESLDEVYRVRISY